MVSNIDLVNACDVFPYQETDPEAYSEAKSKLWTFTSIENGVSTPIGYITKPVLGALIASHDQFQGIDTPYPLADFVMNMTKREVSCLNSGTEQERTAKAAVLTAHWRANKTFKVLGGWRDELYPVYGRDGKLLYSIERTAAALFGIVTYGVHMTAYTKSPSASHGIKIWIPRRSRHKQTYPGLLDNTVAGGMATGEDPLECLVRECEEEASLPNSFVRENAQAFPATTYIYLRNEASTGEIGLVQPEVEYIFDLELPEDMIPKPNDSEVEQFYLWSVEEVMAHMAEGEFKPNCAVVMLDFFIRRGILDEKNEPLCREIQRRVHREMPFPGPHASM